MNELKAMLQMIDPKHSLLLTSRVGLLGNIMENEVDEARLTENIEIVGSWEYHDIKRGDYFTVIGEDGCILFNEYVKSSGLIEENGKTTGYLFVLKDYNASEAFDSFFDDEAESPGLIVYTLDDQLKVNNLKDKSIRNQFIYNDNLKLHGEDGALWMDGNIYCPRQISENNKVYRYTLTKMHL